jgi:type 1 glutamine amidotransferase
MRIRTTLVMAVLLVGALVGPLPAVAQGAPAEVLVFSATYGFRHPVIVESNLAILQMGAASGAYRATVSENPLDLSAASLARYDVVVFNNTSGKTPLTPQQREDLIRWAACGGGTVGIHMSADANYGWPEYHELAGGGIVGHPLTEGNAGVSVTVEQPDHPVLAAALDGVDRLTTADEHHLFRMDPRRLDAVTPLLSLDTDTVPAAIQDGPEAYHEAMPLAWTSTFRGGGRVYYTNFGHGALSWDAPWFRTSIHDGIRWVAEPGVDRDCAASDDPLPPPPAPPAPDPTDPVEPCPLPGDGPYLDTARRLTADGLDPEAAPVGLPLYIFAPNQRFVLDLSEVGARTADLEVVLTWLGDGDLDLGITLPWGYAGSSATPPLHGTVGEERAVVADVPHCTDLLVAVEHGWSTQLSPPRLSIAVTPAGAVAGSAGTGEGRGDLAADPLQGVVHRLR